MVDGGLLSSVPYTRHQIRKPENPPPTPTGLPSPPGTVSRSQAKVCSFRRRDHILPLVLKVTHQEPWERKIHNRSWEEGSAAPRSPVIIR